MLSSKTSMMHQFYIGNRRHWWLFDVTSMFHRCFQCFFLIEASDVPFSKHQWFIAEISVNHQWNNDESPMRKKLCFPGLWLNLKQQNYEFFKSHHFQSNWAKIFVKNLIWKTKEQYFELSLKKSGLVLLKLIFMCTKEHFGRKHFITHNFLDLERKNFKCCSQNWFLRVRTIFFKEFLRVNSALVSISLSVFKKEHYFFWLNEAIFRVKLH